LWGNFAYLANDPHVPAMWAGLWASPLMIGLMLLAAIVALSVPSFRRGLRWRLPTFREASLAQVASAMSLMLKNGVPLGDALTFVQQLEYGTPAAGEIADWRQRLASGHGKISELTRSSRIFPPLFIWTVAQSGEDLTSGFQHAAELYHNRAIYRSELLLYSFLPCSVIVLASMIAIEITPIFGTLTAFITSISGE
jgi:type II secretory pathway component PulF